MGSRRFDTLGSTTISMPVLVPTSRAYTKYFSFSFYFFLILAHIVRDGVYKVGIVFVYIRIQFEYIYIYIFTTSLFRTEFVSLQLETNIYINIFHSSWARSHRSYIFRWFGLIACTMHIHAHGRRTNTKSVDCGRFCSPVSSVWIVCRDFFRFKNKWTFRPWIVKLFYQMLICSVFECRFCFTVLEFQFGLWSCSHTVDATRNLKYGIDDCVSKPLRCSPGPQTSTEHTLTHNCRRTIKFLFKRNGNVNETNS